MQTACRPVRRVAAPSTLAKCAHATLTALHIVMLMFYCLFMVVYSVTCDMHRMLSSDEACTRPDPNPDWTGEGWPDPPHECRHERCDRREYGDALCGECACCSDTRPDRPYCTKCSNAHEEPAETSPMIEESSAESSDPSVEVSASPILCHCGLNPKQWQGFPQKSV